MARKNTGDCIGSDYISFSGAAVQTIPTKLQAGRALLQFYTNETGISTIGRDTMGVNPLVMVTEDGSTPQQGFTSQKGIGLFHMAIYEVSGQANIAAAKFVAFATGYTVF